MGTPQTTIIAIALDVLKSMGYDQARTWRYPELRNTAWQIAADRKV